MNKEQPSWVPKFTKIGFEKTKIPKDVFTMLLWDYQRKKSILYPENFRYGGFINCRKLVNNKKKAQSRIKSLNRTFGITLRFICLDSTTHPHPNLNLPDPNLHLCSLWLPNFKIDLFLYFFGLNHPPPPQPSPGFTLTSQFQNLFILLFVWTHPFPNLNLPDPNLHLCSLWLPNFDFFVEYFFRPPTPPQP